MPLVLQATSQERISERIHEQIAVVPELQSIPQERISERIVEQNVPVSQFIPRERISERIRKQTVDVPPQSIPQERISERIVEQIVDEIPGPAGGGTSKLVSCRAWRCGVPRGRGFSHFSPKEKKCDVRAGVECEPGVALELMDAGGL